MIANVLAAFSKDLDVRELSRSLAEENGFTLMRLDQSDRAIRARDSDN